MKSTRSVATILFLLMASIAAPAARACESTPLDGWPSGDITAHLNQWGILMMAARNTETGCGEDARDKAMHMLCWIQPTFWQQAGAGYFVTLVMATGLEIGGRNL